MPGKIVEAVVDLLRRRGGRDNPLAENLTSGVTGDLLVRAHIKAAFEAAQLRVGTAVEQESTTANEGTGPTTELGPLALASQEAQERVGEAVEQESLSAEGPEANLLTSVFAENVNGGYQQIRGPFRFRL